MSETFGDRIRKARTHYGMSQAELARRIKVSLNTMNKIELGETPDPRASRIKAIALALRVNGNYLLGLSDKMESEPLPTAEPLVGTKRPRSRKTVPVG